MREVESEFVEEYPDPAADQDTEVVDSYSDPKPEAVAVAVVVEPVIEEPQRKDPNIFISVGALTTESNTTNSRSVYLTQEALIARGFLDAGTDNRGTFGVGTEKSLREFCGCASAPCAPHPVATVEKLFEDTNYTIID